MRVCVGMQAAACGIQTPLPGRTGVTFNVTWGQVVRNTVR